MILVTGGAGFIGSYFIHQWLQNFSEEVVCIDKLTYAGDVRRLKHPSIHFFQGDICDQKFLDIRFQQKFSAVFHFAAETHVTNSIWYPEVFVKTNVQGTLNVLQACLQHNTPLIHVSTDEVFGSLVDEPFTEESPYLPSTPYAASKAAADHLVRAFHKTYELPIKIVHGTNNYGPNQHCEKLIPLVVKNALEGKPITVHGDGLGTRDWIHVDDFCSAIRTVHKKGGVGESYVVGARNERRTIDVIESICSILDEIVPKGPSYLEQMVHVRDRPGNDRRYAVNPKKLEALGWKPEFHFALKETVHWYASRLSLLRPATA